MRIIDNKNAIMTWGRVGVGTIRSVMLYGATDPFSPYLSRYLMRIKGYGKNYDYYD